MVTAGKTAGAKNANDHESELCAYIRRHSLKDRGRKGKRAGRKDHAREQCPDGPEEGPQAAAVARAHEAIGTRPFGGVRLQELRDALAAIPKRGSVNR